MPCPIQLFTCLLTTISNVRNSIANNDEAENEVAESETAMKAACGDAVTGEDIVVEESASPQHMRTSACRRGGFDCTPVCLNDRTAVRIEPSPATPVRSAPRRPSEHREKSLHTNFPKTFLST
ncbi:hypothetical protein O0L34_g16208 [Tuta absoluta]|nr:hypothetical protein O0L34_g16208 [Tuta absoluta]